MEFQSILSDNTNTNTTALAFAYIDCHIKDVKRDDGGIAARLSRHFRCKKIANKSSKKDIEIFYEITQLIESNQICIFVKFITSI